MIRKEVSLKASIISKLQVKANKAKRPLKDYMEIVLEQEAEK